MDRNEWFTQRNVYQYKNNLSPFGQKIFNVLLNNWSKEKHCNQNGYNNGSYRRYGQKKILLNCDVSSTPRPQLFSQSEQLGDGDSSRNANYNKRCDHDEGDVVTSADLLPIETSRKNDIEEISSVSDASIFQFKSVQNKITAGSNNARLLKITSTQNYPREDVSNITAGFRHLSPVENNEVKNNPSKITTEFQFDPAQNNPNIVRYNVLSANNNKLKSGHNHQTENNKDIASAGLQRNVTFYKPVLKPANNCNADITSESLLHFQPIQNIDKEHRPNTNPTIPVLIDTLPRTAKEDEMNDDDNSLGFFDFSIVKDDAVENSRSVCRLDLLRPVDFNRSDKLDKPFFESCNKSLDDLTFELSTPIDGNQTRHMEKNNVLWNDMFDTELLPNDVIAPAVKEKNVDEQNAVENHKEFKIYFPKDNTKKQAHSDRNEERNKCRPVKRKKEKTLNKEKTSKKLKESNINIKKNIVRKEKYKKSMKTWFDTVDPNNPIETENIQESKNGKPVESGKEAENKTLDQVIIEDKTLLPTFQRKQKESKKVVQARLANKGGVMKFDKPSVLQESGKEVCPSDTTTAQTTSKVTNRVSLRKVKPNFIAPLKSQIPVKEIEYKVVVVDENNSKEHLTKLQDLKTTEVYAVLTYSPWRRWYRQPIIKKFYYLSVKSNGFCQLNKQFTEDDCIPDGVMLLIDENSYYFQKTADVFSDVIIKFMENHTVVCFDGKNILIFFKHHFDVEINVCMHDVQIGGSLLEPDSPPESFGALQKLAGSAPQYTVATACPRQKTAWYLTQLRECADNVKSKLLDNSLWSLFQDIEMPVLPVIAEMEFHGILVDTEKLQRMEGLLLARMQAVQRRCLAAAGRELQLGSPAQLAAVLYDQLQLHTQANLAVRETLAKGNKSTSEDMLRLLVPLHPLPGLVLEYRRLHKAHATFLAGVRQHVRDGVLRPTWVQTAAATGRVASNNPNVQAIPKAPFSLTSQDSPEEALNLRSVYVAREGCVLLAADFRQVECRVFAAAAADAALLAALTCGRDFFTVLAAQWLKKAEEQVSAADRERTKRIVYASLYGAGVGKLMAMLGVDREQAASVSASFHRTFPSLKRFEQSVARACAAGRAPRTPAGRARALPALASAQPALRARALRQALNFLVQGTAADVCKVAMARAHRALRDAGTRARLLLQIHDELVWELPAPQLPRAHAVLGAAMQASGARAGLSVPLPAALRAGRSWGELADLPDTPSHG